VVHALKDRTQGLALMTATPMQVFPSRSGTCSTPSGCLPNGAPMRSCGFSRAWGRPAIARGAATTRWSQALAGWQQPRGKEG
jgi:hypothetical protein